MCKKLRFLISFVLVLTLASTSYGGSPFFKLDMDDLDDPNAGGSSTEPGFTSFFLEESGREVNGITIELSGDLYAARRGEPNKPDGDWYHELYRDFIFGIYPSGIDITLWGLGDGRKVDITIYAFDALTDGDRVANWSTPTEPNIIQTWFDADAGDILKWPGYIGDKNWYAFTGTGTADKYGRIILTSDQDPCSINDVFAYINGLIVEPNLLGPGYVPVEEATIPRPVNKQERVPPDDILKWRPGAYANKHDVYLGTDESAVTDANRSNPMGVLVSENQDANTYDWDGYIHMDKTYYWRIDEVNSVSTTIWPGEVWHFTVRDHVVIDDFDSYVSSDALKDVWEDFWVNGTSAEVFIDDINALDGISMRYFYDNDYELFYSDAEASTAALGLESDWLSGDAKSLGLYFYGRAGNPVSEQMYMGLTDGDGNTAFVPYDGDMNDVKKEEWQEWNVLLQDFVDANDVNLANVASITIRFGEPGGSVGTEGTVNFDDFKMYPSRCVLSLRSAALAKVDYVPAGVVAGDCMVDYREIEVMGSDWLLEDEVIRTKNPNDVNLVIFYRFEEGDGNKVYPHPSGRLNDPCLWSGTSWNSSLDTPRNTASFSTDHAPGIGGSYSLYFDGEAGCRVTCGTAGQAALGITPEDANAITLSVWVKPLGQRTWDPYLASKALGILGKRGGWTPSTVIWFFGLVEDADQLFVSARTINLYSDNVLDAFIGQWMHLAATYPHPNDSNVNDPNEYARLYLNGSEFGYGPFYFDDGNDNAIFLTIGNTMDQNSWGNSPENFWGYIDEVRIYDRALEPNEIAYLADPTPEDGNLMRAIPSSAEVYKEEPEGSRVVNFRDFALLTLTDVWLREEYWP